MRVIVYIGKPQITRLDEIIAGLAVKRLKELDYLYKITGRKILHYTEKIESQGTKISHYLEIGVGGNNNLDILIRVNANELYINRNHLPLSEIETTKCLEGQIKSI